MNAGARIGNWLAALALVFFADAGRAEVIGNWDFSSGSLAGTAESQVRLRHAPDTAAFTTYRTAYNAFYAPVYGSLLPVSSLVFGPTESFSIQSLGGPGRTVLRVPDARGAGQLTGLIADFDLASPAKINRYTVIMDVLIPQSTFSETNRWVSLFQPRANADGLLFADTNLNDSGGYNFGVAGGYAGGFLPDVWQRIALVIDLEAQAGQPRYMSYLNGVPGAAIETPGADRDPSVDGPLSIGALTDSNPTEAPTLFNDLEDAAKSTLFFFNDQNNDLGTLYVANLQFRDAALSAGAIAALGGPTAAAIAVPEPSSMGLMALGLAICGAMMRRGQRNASSVHGRWNRACG